jgi:gamma-glutamylputrescine oxidase
MNRMWPLQDQTLWYLKQEPVESFRQDLQVDVAIVGGGMAGLAAAQAFHKRGKKVVVLEQYFCGGGASGKSSGFITPNAELSFTDFTNKFGAEAAHTIWDSISSGVEDIRSNIKQYNFACDYLPQDTLVVANSRSGLKTLEVEHNNLSKFGYKSSIYGAEAVRDVIGSKNYYGGFGYADTFGINPYAYCQELKKLLQAQGVQIFEETPVTSIGEHALTTAHAKVTADYIVVCTDRFLPELNVLPRAVYHAQTFLMVSQQLSESVRQEIFPKGNRLVWDTALVYSYFRFTGDNRLLLGGGNIIGTYAKKAWHEYTAMQRKLINYFDEKFPGLTPQFEYMYPGLIGLSKDIAPLAGRDKTKPYIFYVSACAGLPIAAALGRYSAENLIDGNTYLDHYFSPYRNYLIGNFAQSILGTRLTFALSNLIASRL